MMIMWVLLKKKKNISNPEHVKRKNIMNSLSVLLTRDTKGLYVCTYNDELREGLMQSNLSKWEETISK